MGAGAVTANVREHRNGDWVDVAPPPPGRAWVGAYIAIPWCEPGWELFELIRLGIMAEPTQPDAGRRSMGGVSGMDMGNWMDSGPATLPLELPLTPVTVVDSPASPSRSRSPRRSAKLHLKCVLHMYTHSFIGLHL